MKKYNFDSYLVDLDDDPGKRELAGTYQNEIQTETNSALQSTTAELTDSAKVDGETVPEQPKEITDTDIRLDQIMPTLDFSFTIGGLPFVFKNRKQLGEYTVLDNDDVIIKIKTSYLNTHKDIIKQMNFAEDTIIEEINTLIRDLGMEEQLTITGSNDGSYILSNIETEEEYVINPEKDIRTQIVDAFKDFDIKLPTNFSENYNFGIGDFLGNLAAKALDKGNKKIALAKMLGQSLATVNATTKLLRNVEKMGGKKVSGKFAKFVKQSETFMDKIKKYAEKLDKSMAAKAAKSMQAALDKNLQYELDVEKSAQMSKEANEKIAERAEKAKEELTNVEERMKEISDKYKGKVDDMPNKYKKEYTDLKQKKEQLQNLIKGTGGGHKQKNNKNLEAIDEKEEEQSEDEKEEEQSEDENELMTASYLGFSHHFDKITRSFMNFSAHKVHDKEFGVCWEDQYGSLWSTNPESDPNAKCLWQADTGKATPTNDYDDEDKENDTSDDGTDSGSDNSDSESSDEMSDDDDLFGDDSDDSSDSDEELFSADDDDDLFDDLDEDEDDTDEFADELEESDNEEEEQNPSMEKALDVINSMAKLLAKK